MPWRPPPPSPAKRGSWILWNLSFRYIPFHEERLQMMLWHHKARVNSHQRWKQTRFRVCFHLWCELTSTMNVTEWQVSWNSWQECWLRWWLTSMKLLKVVIMCRTVVHISLKNTAFVGPRKVIQVGITPTIWTGVTKLFATFLGISPHHSVSAECTSTGVDEITLSTSWNASSSSC